MVRPESDARRLAYWLIKKINRANRDFGLIADGERIAIGVSGGKDSLALLRLLDWRLNSSAERYEIVAIHVAADSRGPQTPAHPVLRTWLEAQGYTYRLVLPDFARDETLPMGCQRCTWLRRKALFETAHDLRCSALAYGHHADDLAQTTLLNLIYHGRAETMAPARRYFGGAIRLIRPLCYIAEKELARFAAACDFPPPPPLCERSSMSRRELGKALLAEAQKANPEARINLLRAGLRGLSAP